MVICTIDIESAVILDLFGNLDREEKKKYTIHEVKGRWTTKKE
jgi:hypothetical protein